MKTKAIRHIVLFVLLILPLISSSQYYDWGQSPSSIKWKVVESKYNKFIFPNYYIGGVSRIMSVMDLVHDDIGFGYEYGPMKLPIILHTQNFQSNGIVLLAPKRMEFIVNPLGAESATPWYKQLAIHEYRHAVQFNNTNRNFIKAISYLFGQQGSLLGGLLFPTWLLEGDAVLAETAMTSFGRGLQPSYTIEYRAMMGEGDELYGSDKYFCGSYRDFIPDHYQTGYQMASYAYYKYGQNIGNDIASFASKYPYTVLTSTFSLKKYYNTSESKLLYEALGDLRNHWSLLPKEENSSTFIETPITSYTTYGAPAKINDSTVVAIKSDFDRYKRIVRININTGEESIEKYVGNTNSQPIYKDGKLYWSEYSNSSVWGQRVGSVVCSYDFTTKKLSYDKSNRNAIYPAPMDCGVAYVEYNYNGRYDIVSDDMEWNLPLDISIHGLAYDNVSGLLYFLALDQSGMWIGRCNSDKTYSAVTVGSASTLSRLKASNGKLFFNSIQSGKDEVHMYDLARDEQWQVTTSKYGSFNGVPTSDGKEILMTTYATVQTGYLPAIQTLNIDSMKRVEYSRLPSNRINPKRCDFGLINIDDIHIDTLSQKELKSKPYRKGLHLFNVHSWAPMSFDPEKFISENNFDIYAGVTVMSQNVLSSMTSFLSYGWTSGGSLIRGGVNYSALAPKFEVSASYGGSDQYLKVGSDYSLLTTLPPMSELNRFFEINGRVYLPLILSSGYRLRYLTPSVELYHDNALLLSKDSKSYSHKGLQRFTASIMYAENVRMTIRDLLPRFGYAFNASYTINPFRDDFGTIWSLYGRGYLPGLAPQHSLMLRGTVQSQDRGYYNYSRTDLFPRGAYRTSSSNQYMAFSVDYKLPIWYPEGGIPGFIYFKRIHINLAGDYAIFKDNDGGSTPIYSYGGEITFDINPLSLPSSTRAAISISIYKPSNRDGVVVGGGISLPI